jgi:hypothetical protein
MELDTSDGLAAGGWLESAASNSRQSRGVRQLQSLGRSLGDGARCDLGAPRTRVSVGATVDHRECEGCALAHSHSCSCSLLPQRPRSSKSDWRWARSQLRGPRDAHRRRTHRQQAHWTQDAIDSHQGCRWRDLSKEDFRDNKYNWTVLTVSSAVSNDQSWPNWLFVCSARNRCDITN